MTVIIAGSFLCVIGGFAVLMFKIAIDALVYDETILSIVFALLGFGFCIFLITVIVAVLQ